MKINKKKINAFIILNFFIGVLLGFFMSISVAIGAAAVWHGTQWIGTGKMIFSQELTENFEYLYQNKADTPLECWGTGKRLEWKNGAWNCRQ